jgi:hypothetical protein
MEGKDSCDMCVPECCGIRDNRNRLQYDTCAEAHIVLWEPMAIVAQSIRLYGAGEGIPANGVALRAPLRLKLNFSYIGAFCAVRTKWGSAVSGGGMLGNCITGAAPAELHP